LSPRIALGLGPHRDRHHRLELGVGVVAVREEVGAQRAGDDREHDVVDRAAERVLDRLEIREVAVDPGEPAVRPDAHVQRRRRRTAQPSLGDRGQAADRLRPGGDGPLGVADRAGRRAGQVDGPGSTLGHRVGEQHRPGRLGPRDPRLGRRRGGRIGVEVEQHGREVDARDPVHERVVGLADQREAPVVHAVDQPQLPQRLRPVEPLREDPAGQPPQLGLARRLRQRRVADVIAGVEVRVVDPHRPALHERRERQLLAVARHESEPALELGDEVVVRRRLAAEHEDRADVHVRVAALLEREKRGVEPGQTVGVRHAADSRAPRAARAMRFPVCGAS
jgi:hypothetical protein